MTDQERGVQFEDVIARMPAYLRALENSRAIRKDNRGRFSPSLTISNGNYVFYEGDKPMYVGRSGKNRLKDRLHEHSRKSSKSNKASFAFEIAKREHIKETIKKFNSQDISFSEMEIELTKLNWKREDLENDREFKGRFHQAKERVKGMSIRVVEIEDSIEQTIFEVYAHMMLKTPFNDFDTS